MVILQVKLLLERLLNIKRYIYFTDQAEAGAERRPCRTPAAAAERQSPV